MSELFKRLVSVCVGLAVLGFVSLPASARQHAGERPEPARHGRGADDGAKHASAAKSTSKAKDDRGANRRNDAAKDKKDDRGTHAANHK